MDRIEKLFLVQLLLKDLRGNWANDVMSRLQYALRLAQELDLPEHARVIQTGISDQEEGYFDGRMFRMDWNSGGYENAAPVHGLPPTIMPRSDDFKRVAGTLLTYPEYGFEDWDAYLESLPS